MQCNNKKLLGRGRYGSVFLGTFEGKTVAVKRIELIGEDVLDDNELKTLQQLDHPHVIKLLHFESDENFK